MISPSRKWKHAREDMDLADRLSRELDIPMLLSRLLVARGMVEARIIHDYLNPNLRQLHDPFLLDGMDVAVLRIERALREGEVIGIHGDYDTDGITSTALLVNALKERAPPKGLVHKLPSRFVDGYGISNESVRSMSESGVTLLISVDCGVQAVDAVDLARSLGMDVIVTDHHEVGPELPRALSILDPKVKGSTYPFKGLSGVGVAFKLVHALRFRDVLHGDIRQHLDLVALGTIADLVPLVDENRSLVREGLEVLSRTSSTGLLSLMRETGIDPAKGMNSMDISHRIAPRLNAAGRLGNPEMALELLLTSDRVDADVFARELGNLNFRRQAIATKVMDEALAIARSTGLLERPSIVVAKEGWNPGVLGIAASRLVEETGKPSLVLAVEEGTARGSARAPAGFDLLTALESCSGTLQKWGGHDKAAGVTLEAEAIGRFNDALDRFTVLRYPGGLPPPLLEVDLDLTISELDVASVRSLELMQPTGLGNPPPAVSLRDVRVGPRVQAVGGGKHLRFELEDDEGKVNCIWFNSGHLLGGLGPGSMVSICGTPDINRWGGNEEVQVRTLDMNCQDE